MSREIKEVKEMLELLGPALTNYPPEISNLDVTPVLQLVPATVEFDYSDLDGDIETVYTTVQQLSDSLGSVASDSRGTIVHNYPAASFGISGTSGHASDTEQLLPEGAGTFLFTVWVTDAEGNMSNLLTRTIQIVIG